MTISKKIEGFMTKASWIRRMFEEGNKLKARFGEDSVFDFTLGNPLPSPPEQVISTLKRIAGSDDPDLHRYMNNAGYSEVRASIAGYLSGQVGLPFGTRHVLMTVGAAGAMNVFLKAVLDPGDEVIIIAPYFVEYLFYIDNHGGTPVKVDAADDFDLDVDAIERAVTSSTKAVVICTPNNPTGVVYSDETLERLGRMLEEKERETGRVIYLVSDEPYRKILYDLERCPSHLNHYRDSILITSHSKDLALPGERIGYVTVHPEIEGVDQLVDAMTFTNRTLGFVNAPALWQRVAGVCQDASVDVEWYRQKRDLLYDGLTSIGYEMVKPGGAFYLFPRSPLEDDQAFARLALEERLLVVPGSGFGTPGHFRIAYCTVSEETIERALPVFEQVRRGVLEAGSG
jgi:aspartate aminotransferase